jgi:competence protein ComEA
MLRLRGQTASALRSKYDRLEAKARRDRLGAWGESASVPTIALTSGEADEERPWAAVAPVSDPRADQEVSAEIAATAIEGAVFLIGQGTDNGAGAAENSPATAPSQPASITGKISLNNGTLAELEALPEIGPKTAQAIIDGRPYAKVEDVDRVPGIGPKAMQAILPLLAD